MKKFQKQSAIYSLNIFEDIVWIYTTKSQEGKREIDLRISDNEAKADSGDWNSGGSRWIFVYPDQFCGF